MLLNHRCAGRVSSGIVYSALLGLGASPVGLADDAANAQPTSAAAPATLFSTELPDVPGKQLVVVSLKFPPGKIQQGGHRHPGSVFVYVTEGTVRLGIEGQPVREVHTGESFFEPPGALHTVAESASSTQSASAIAVLIVPDGAPLLKPEQMK